MLTWEKTYSDMGHLEPPLIKVKRLRPWAKLPVKATEGAACYDIHFAMNRETKALLKHSNLESVPLDPGQSLRFGTGLAFEIPPGWEMQVRPRSGLANKQNLIVPNSPGTVDSDYRGEVFVGLKNIGKLKRTIDSGDRIAQITFRRVPEVKLIEVDELSETERGEGGFGSTGVK